MCSSRAPQVPAGAGSGKPEVDRPDPGEDRCDGGDGPAVQVDDLHAATIYPQERAVFVAVLDRLADAAR
jgi:hypothetical protein